MTDVPVMRIDQQIRLEVALALVSKWSGADFSRLVQDVHTLSEAIISGRSTPIPEAATMPDLIGLSGGEAADRLSELGLAALILPQGADPAWYVYDQKPSPGSPLPSYTGAITLLLELPDSA